jgi:hypothetical protein
MGVGARCRCAVRAGQRFNVSRRRSGNQTASGGDCGLTSRQRGGWQPSPARQPSIGARPDPFSPLLAGSSSERAKRPTVKPRRRPRQAGQNVPARRARSPFPSRIFVVGVAYTSNKERPGRARGFSGLLRSSNIYVLDTGPDPRTPSREVMSLGSAVEGPRRASASRP